MSRETTRVVLVLAMSLHGPDEGLGEAGKKIRLGEPGGGGEMLFYVRRHSCADGAFYGHTRRRASSAPGLKRTDRTTPCTAADERLAAFTRPVAVPTICAGSGR